MPGKPSHATEYDYIQDDSQMEQLVARCQPAEAIYFDTEFVSEDSYYPELCLIQLVADSYVALIDGRRVDSQPFWNLLVEGDHLTVVHAGREEFHFCMRHTQSRPRHWIDVQVGAALCGIEYPAAIGKLHSRLLGINLPKGETRTDWRKRPLSSRQLDYALQDVIHLPSLWSALRGRLAQLQREDWLQAEMSAWQDDQAQSLQRERWRRMSGISGLSPRALAMVRELWMVREQEAQQRNLPAKRLLRDDLIVELARRGIADEKKVRDVRGLQQSRLGGKSDALAAAIQRGLDLPADQLPRSERTHLPAQVNSTAQFLATALAGLCRRQQLAPGLVGTVQDVRDLLIYWHDPDAWGEPELPSLARGWRAQIIGSTLRDLWEGRAVVRVHDPFSEEPLEIVPWMPPSRQSSDFV